MITDADVKDMGIRIYAMGTDVVNVNEEFFSTDVRINNYDVGYEIGEIYGNDVDGYYIDIDFHFVSGGTLEAYGRDAFNNHVILKNYPEWQGNWVI